MLVGRFIWLATLVSATVAEKAALRYMPFGDSITESVCWRSKLWHKLRKTEWRTVDWVGSSKKDNNCGDTTYDRDNEGHSGYLAVNIAEKKQLVGWLKANPADVITMHLGTNDIQHNKSVDEIIDAFTTLVRVMRDSNPSMKIIAAQILPIEKEEYKTQVQKLNEAIIPWAERLNTTASPIWVVDQYTGVRANTDFRDRVHPNDAGDVKMMNVWFPALTNAFRVAQEGKPVPTDITT
ncbi:carbohydrate esterase family 3 protein [Xylariaceae sp. FL0662B]|nr:carbohydrate esterase family 3 protein [Xylariaceae sp. FL0662B]